VKLPFDRVILSSDENRTYLDFWPHVAYAYRTMFPGVKVTLAFLSDRAWDDPLVKELVKHGDVQMVRTVKDVPKMSQAKLIRYVIASFCDDNEVCFIDDLDEIPINRDWHIEKVAFRKPGTMLMVGAEVYGPNYGGQVPASMMTAEAWVFRKLFGCPQSTDAASWYLSLHKLRRSDEDHTNVFGANFSDEALIVRLREENAIAVTHVERGYRPGIDTIDRGAWPYIPAKLESGGYLAAHTARPYRAFKEGNDAIIDYIRRTYDGAAMPEPLS
jgi:hypothetical protein